MTETNIVAAGIDTGKHKLDVAIHGDSKRWQFDNTPAGISDLVRLLRRRKVSRVGIEATGGYERKAVTACARPASRWSCCSRPRSVATRSRFSAGPRATGSIAG